MGADSQGLSQSFGPRNPDTPSHPGGVEEDRRGPRVMEADCLRSAVRRM
jgi:hypothetical protein